MSIFTKMPSREEIVCNSLAILFIPTLLFGVSVGLTLFIGIDSLKHEKNTGGTASITHIVEDELNYGKCQLTLKYQPINSNLTIVSNVSALCMPDPIGKVTPICYNRWKPGQVTIDDKKLTSDHCAGTGYNAAVRCVWAGSILLAVYLMIVISIAYCAWKSWPKYQEISNDAGIKIEMA